LRITGTEEFAAAATKQVFPSKGVLFGHAYSSMGPVQRALLLTYRAQNSKA